jgi:hypothetical protein
VALLPATRLAWMKRLGTAPCFYRPLTFEREAKRHANKDDTPRLKWGDDYGPWRAEGPAGAVHAVVVGGTACAGPFRAREAGAGGSGGLGLKQRTKPRRGGADNAPYV